MAKTLLLLLLGGLAGYYWGWARAHLAVATECRQLGGFFVGDTVYQCTKIKEPKSFQLKAPPPLKDAERGN